MWARRLDAALRLPSATERFFFIHVMKTGGITFRRHLLQQFPPEEVYPDPALDWRVPFDVDAYTSVERFMAIPRERRDVIRVYSGHVPFVLTEMMGGGFVSLTILRDPAERVVSVLKHFKRLVGRYSDMTLEEIYDDPILFPHFFQNHQVKQFSVTEADRPKAFAAAANAGDPAQPATPIEVDSVRVDLAKANLARVDVVGLNSGYSEFVDELHARFGWWPSGVDLEVRENASSESWRADDSLIARIVADNEADLDFYEFAQQLVERRRRETGE